MYDDYRTLAVATTVGMVDMETVYDMKTFWFFLWKRELG